MATSEGCPDAFARLSAMALVVCSHALAIRATHGSDLTPLGLATLEVPAEPFKVRQACGSAWA